VFTYRNGDKYEGSWQNGRRHGSGTLWVLRGGKFHARFSGGWANDVPEVGGGDSRLCEGLVDGNPQHA
jgi:hypothetical protein